MCIPRTTTHWKCPSWFTIRCTSIRTPTKVIRNETEAMNMRRRGRSGIVVADQKSQPRQLQQHQQNNHNQADKGQ